MLVVLRDVVHFANLRVLNGKDLSVPEAVVAKFARVQVIRLVSCGRFASAVDLGMKWVERVGAMLSQDAVEALLLAVAATAPSTASLAVAVERLLVNAPRWFPWSSKCWLHFAHFLIETPRHGTIRTVPPLSMSSSSFVSLVVQREPPRPRRV